MSPKTSPIKKLPHRECLKVAVLAEVDPRSVNLYFTQPEAARPATKRVIRMALAQLGMPDPHPELTSGAL